jgi:4-hydroxy-tetrahydrodipicolinate synthase
MGKNDLFRGTGVAIVTPFTSSWQIDFLSYEKILNHVIVGGVEFIVVLGTTGEAATLSMEERSELVNFSIEKIADRVSLVVGVGGNSTADVVRALSSIPQTGVDAILSVCPYYNKPQQEGIYQHFKAVAEGASLPVIIYNVPGRTASNISATTCLRLANDCPNIIGVKEASGNFDQIGAIIKNRPDGFLVLSGDDALTLPLISAGADGVISVVANVYPKEFSDMVRHSIAGNFETARKLHYNLVDFIHALFADGSPAGAKAALEIKSLCANYLRLPLVSVNESTYLKIKSLVELIG